MGEGFWWSKNGMIEMTKRFLWGEGRGGRDMDLKVKMIPRIYGGQVCALVFVIVISKGVVRWLREALTHGEIFRIGRPQGSQSRRRFWETTQISLQS